MPATILTTPPELLERIVLWAIGDTSCGSPSVLLSLRLTCRKMDQALSMEQNPHLYLMLFLGRFDISALRRRLRSDRVATHNIAQELRKRYTALHRIRRKEIHHPDLVGVFSTLYTMVLEDDGRNCEQICWADLSGFLQEFLSQRLLEGAVDNNGWPLENELNTLAVALFWFITSHRCIREETTQFRRDFMDLLSLYAYAWFRYPCFTEPEYLFHSHHAALLAVPSHGSFPSPCTVTMQYFGEETTLTLPPIALFAILIEFAKVEQSPLKIPPELPASHHEALMRGIAPGPTKEDIEYFNTKCKTRFTHKTCCDGLQMSREYDPDWYWALRDLSRSSLCISPGAYVPGTLTGRWLGSFMTPFIERGRSILPSDAPLPLPASSRFPFFVRFREYYCYSQGLPVPVMDDENAFSNAFLPPGCRWYSTEGGIEFVGQNNSFRAFYTSHPQQVSYSRGARTAADGGICDVVIVGETEEPYATAWKGYKYIGRIRPSDGLIILLRVPNSGLGRALLRGYVMSSRNFIGRWRGISDSEEEFAVWESTFCLSKDITTPESPTDM